MKKFLVWLRRIDYRHYICAGIVFGSFMTAIFVFPHAFMRVGESMRDLWVSLKFYFTELFLNEHTVTPTVTDLSAAPFRLPFNLPNNWEEFKVMWGEYWQRFVSVGNVEEYFRKISLFLYDFAYFLLIVTPFFVVLLLYIRQLIKQENNDYNEDTKALKVWKKISLKTYVPVKDWIISFVGFVKENKAYIYLTAIIWAYSFNLFSVIVSAAAYYLYFIPTFDFAGIVRQIFKLLLDLSPMMDFVPLFVWIIFGYFVFDRIRKSIGYTRLNHWENKNRGFINSLPVVVMGCGTMGSKKTTVITDMSLSEEVIFRNKAFELILENDLKFPYFPWINLENALIFAIEKHIVYNLATVKKYIDFLRFSFECDGDKAVKKSLRRQIKKIYGINYCNLLFDYDYERYGLTYNDMLKVVNVWDVIRSYAQLYFIYIIESSLILSNYSVRVDNVLSDKGNFPLWDTDFFKRDSRYAEAYSRHAHILDFDALRLGKKLVENNPYADSFEFGIVNITEVGKERGNTLELAEKKRNSDETNQKNDLFDSELKMIRHSATVDNFPFVKVFTDEQRPESWGANARDLCNILNMRVSSEMRLAMPFFDLEELLYSFVFGKFENLYYEYRYNHGDNTLFMHFIKAFVSFIHHRYKALYNTFGYMNICLLMERGTQDGIPEEHDYTLAVKKIYSNRFSTDCHAGFFYKKALRSPVGLDDLPEYETERATMEELERQNSYFVNDLKNGL